MRPWGRSRCVLSATGSGCSFVRSSRSRFRPCCPFHPRAVAGTCRAEGLNAANLARFTADQLRSVGLSRQKASYLADLAGKVNNGTVELRQIGRLPDERVVEQLTQVKGIGRWTAQMFLIFSLGRLDVFPHDNLGVRTAIRNRYRLADLPDKATAFAIAGPCALRFGGKLVLLADAGFGPKHGPAGKRVSDVTGLPSRR